MMNTGEIIVYAGDPATTFTKVGSYKAPKPVGVNSWVKVGGELVVITENGPIPISFIYRGVAFDLTELQVWGKIAPSWQADYRTSSANSGFFGRYFNGVLYFNIPTSTGSSKQYVLNTRIPAWSVYTNIPVASMADISGSLYFGSCTEGYVNLHGGANDNGSQIISTARQAFSFPMGRNKSVSWTLMRPKIDTSGIVSGQFQVDVDFTSANISAPVVSLSNVLSGSAWGAAWGSAWASAPATQQQFIGVLGYGCAVAPVAVLYSKADSVAWYSSDLVGLQGGIL
jgi:hypothetical protein